MSSNGNIQSVLSLYRLVLLVVAGYFLLVQNALTALFGLPTFIDEGLQALMLLLVIANTPFDERLRKPFLLYCAACLFLLIISVEALGHRGLSNVLQQIFIHLKYAVFFVFLIHFVDRPTILFLVKSFFWVTLFFLAVNFVVPGSMTTMLGQELSYRYGLPRPVGVQGQTGNLGFTLGLYCVYYVTAHTNLVSETQKYLKLFGFFVLIILSTVRSALVVFPLLFVWRIKQSALAFGAISLLVALLVSAVGVNKIGKEIVSVTQQNIDMMVEDPSQSAYIRGMMIYFSLDLAVDRFPLGTGASSFGTVMSDNSAIYTEIGMQNSRFFIEKEGIYDSNIASLTGEFGFIGAALYYAFFYFFLRSTLRAYGLSLGSEANLAFFLFFFAYSVTGPVFMNTYQIFLFLIVLLASCRPVERAEKDHA